MSAHESERQTRKTRIDPKLNPSGWSVVPFGGPGPIEPSVAIEEYETSLGPADYVLADRNDLLGVVEAKKLTVGPQGVLPQAERYAKAIPNPQPSQGLFGVPFLYSTNGEEIWFHDVRHALNRSRRVATFHTTKAMRRCQSPSRLSYRLRFRRLRSNARSSGESARCSLWRTLSRVGSKTLRMQ